MQACDLLKNNPDPTETEIREGMEGNLCRCTGYQNIVKAVQQAAGAMSASAERWPRRRRRHPGMPAGPPRASRR